MEKIGIGKARKIMEMEKIDTALRHAIDEAAIVSITDEKGEITYVNENFRNISGYPLSEIAGKDYRLINSGHHGKELYNVLWDTILNGNIWRGETCSQARDGSIFWLDNTIVPVKGKNSEQSHFVSFGVDISDKKRNEKRLSKYNEELRKLASHLQDAREEERHLLANQLQDDLGQLLTAMKFELCFIHSQQSDEITRKTTAGILDFVNQAIHSVRKMAVDLAPSILYDLGLIEAIQWQSNEFGERFGINTRFVDNVGELALPLKIKLALFRIFQEALTNIASYAEASQVFVVLKAENGMLHLVVQDDGNGFDLDLMQSGRSFGLTGMREQATNMNGRLEISTAQGQGTIIEIIVPL